MEIFRGDPGASCWYDEENERYQYAFTCPFCGSIGAPSEDGDWVGCEHGVAIWLGDDEIWVDPRFERLLVERIRGARERGRASGGVGNDDDAGASPGDEWLEELEGCDTTSDPHLIADILPGVEIESAGFAFRGCGGGAGWMVAFYPWDRSYGEEWMDAMRSLGTVMRRAEGSPGVSSWGLFLGAPRAMGGAGGRFLWFDDLPGLLNFVEESLPAHWAPGEEWWLEHRGAFRRLVRRRRRGVPRFERFREQLNALAPPGAEEIAWMGPFVHLLRGRLPFCRAFRARVWDLGVASLVEDGEPLGSVLTGDAFREALEAFEG